MYTVKMVGKWFDSTDIEAIKKGKTIFKSMDMAKVIGFLAAVINETEEIDITDHFVIIIDNFGKIIK